MTRRLKITGLVLLGLFLLPFGGLADLAARVTGSLAARAVADQFGDAHDRILRTIEGLLE